MDADRHRLRGARSRALRLLRVTALAALAAAAAATAACKAPPPPLVLPDVAIVAPVNFDSTSPPQIRAGEEHVQALVEAYLERSGVRVQPVEPPAFIEAWEAELGDTARAKLTNEGFAAILGRVLERLAEPGTDTVLVVPHVLYRQAKLVGTKGRWDGVGRKVVIEGLWEIEGIEFHGQFSGDIVATSARIRVVDRQATVVHEGFGGIDLAQKLSGGTRGSVYRYQWTDRTGGEIFEDKSNIASAIVTAFDPFIPKSR